MKKFLFSSLAIATFISSTYLATSPEANASEVATAKNLTTGVISKFTDVKGHWAESAIAKAYDLHLIAGYQDGSFKPNSQITRAEFATILSRATKLPSATSSNPFSDMKGNWANAAVAQLVAQGIINPSDYPNGFKPNTQLTRYEMMQWIANGLVQSDDSFNQAFTDTKKTLLPTPEATRKEISADKVPYIALVRGTGIVGGFEDGTLKPQNTTTRAEVSAIILRYIDVEGKSADSYPELRELREVGKTGTNVISLTGYKYTSGTTFANMINTPITLTNKSGQLKIKKMIVVDSRSKVLKGVYASLFHPNVERYQMGNFIAYAELDLTCLTDKPNIITYSQGVTSPLLPIFRIRDQKFVSSVGIETWPYDSITLPGKNVTKTFWTTTTIEPTGGYAIVNDKGTIVSIEKD